MFLAQVTGVVVATQKVASMTGSKLLTVEPLRVDPQGRDRLVGTGRSFVVRGHGRGRPGRDGADRARVRAPASRRRRKSCRSTPPSSASWTASTSRTARSSRRGNRIRPSYGPIGPIGRIGPIRPIRRDGRTITPCKSPTNSSAAWCSRCWPRCATARPPRRPTATARPPAPAASSSDVNQAVAAATEAQRRFEARGLDDRRKAVACIRRICTRAGRTARPRGAGRNEDRPAGPQDRKADGHRRPHPRRRVPADRRLQRRERRRRSRNTPRSASSASSRR